MSTDLAALEAHLLSLGNPLVLHGTDDRLGPLQSVVASMPDGTITIDTGATPVHVVGDTLTAAGSCSASWPVQGLGKATLDLASATLTVTTAGVTTAVIAATLPLAPGVAPGVQATPVAGQPGAWSIALTGSTGGVTPTELIALGLGTGPLPFVVPPTLDVFGQLATVEPAAFTIIFAPNELASSAYYAFGVEVATGVWHLIPDVVDFTGLDVLAVITSDAWSVTLVGHLTVAGVAMTLGIQVGSSSVWVASLAPVGTSFPGIVELANWFSSGSSLGQQTASGFTDLQLDPSAFDLALAGVQLSFDTATAKVVSLEIDSVLTVVGLDLDLVLLLPTITLAGSLAQPGTAVVDMLRRCQISTAGVPAGLTIADAGFTADASTRTYTARTVVSGVWPTGPLQLNEIGTTIGYAAGDWTGTFDAQLGIAGVDVDLSATYDGTGWQFVGRTLPGTAATIGALIGDLSTEFGIGTVPAAIASLTLTELHVGYATATGAFSFGCTCTLMVEGAPAPRVAEGTPVTSVEGKQITLVVEIDVTKTTPEDAADRATTVGTRGYSARFGGTVTFDDLQFRLVFDLAADSSDIFVADYSPIGTPKPAQLKALVAALSDSLAAAVPAGVEIDLQEVKFCFYKSTATWWAFGLRLGTTIDLSKLPVVGSKLPPDLTLGVENFQALYANAAFTTEQIDAVNTVLPDTVTKLPDTLGEGISLQGTLSLGSASLDIGTGVKPASPQVACAPGTDVVLRAPRAVPATASTDPITWVDVNKQFGIFTFRRVGIGYADNRLLFSLDAAVALGPLAFSLVGLTVGSPLDAFDPSFDLRGLSLSFDRPPIQLGGAFLKVTQTQGDKTFDAYYGEVLVRLPQFSLTAVGGWAPDANPAMFFLYLAVDAPIGGPPFLQVTGLSGGFGINSRLVLPEIDAVSTYVLMPGPSAPKQPSDPADVLSDVVPRLQSTFEVQAGQYWVAAGIAASSFEMINVQAVLSVGFGVDVQIGIVGSGSMTLPTGDPTPAAYIEIDVVASYTPSTGILSIIGKLSPASYLFGGFVKLTGGFALCVWFKDTLDGGKAGDFVVTVGGYHPAFDPGNYPVVPRLGIAFSLGPIKVVGRAYVALTPGALMAGLALEATFAAGPISAWFTAGLDFLIAWAPFHYTAHAWVAIGCKVDLGLFSIRVQVGADLQIWGPPFGGQAVVDLDVVSFTIAFGAPAQQPAPVGWTTLAANFLPKPGAGPAPLLTAAAVDEAAVDAAMGDGAALDEAATPPSGAVSAAVPTGLVSTTDPDLAWIVDGNAFVIAIRCTVPANQPQLVTGVDTTGADTSVRLPNLVSAYTRELTKITASGGVGAVAADSDPPLADVLPADLRLALDAGTDPYSTTEVWRPDLDVAPMHQSGVTSRLTITVQKLPPSGSGSPTYLTNLTVLPQLSNANAALWGDGSATTEVNGERLVPYALVGLDLAPVPRHPDSVNDVALLELIFGEGTDTGFVFQPLALPSTYTAHGVIGHDGTTLDITVGGAHTQDLPNTGYVLSALADPWVDRQRVAVLDALSLLGLGTPSSIGVSVHDLATVQLDGWPSVALIGQPA